MQACALHNCSKALKLACSLPGPRDFLPLRTFTKVQRLRRWEHAFLSAPVWTYRPWQPATRLCDWLISHNFADDGEQSLCRRRFVRSYWIERLFVLCTQVILNCKRKKKRNDFFWFSQDPCTFVEVGHAFLNFGWTRVNLILSEWFMGRVDWLYVRTIERFSVIPWK